MDMIYTQYELIGLTFCRLVSVLNDRVFFLYDTALQIIGDKRR